MVIRNPVPEGSNAEAFACVVAGCDVVDAVLGRLVHDPLGGLAGDVGVETGGDRLVELALSGTGDDANRRHEPIPAFEYLGFAVARLRDGGKKLFSVDRLRKNAADPCRCAGMESKALELFEPESSGQLRRVAQLEVAIERQVIGDQRDAVFDQEAHALPKRADDPWCFRSVPQYSVVNDDGVRLALRRQREELSRGRNCGDDSLDLRTTFDLEPVGAVIRRTIGFEQLVELGDQLQEIHAPMVAQLGAGDGRMVDTVGASRLTSVLMAVVVALLTAACGRGPSGSPSEFSVSMLTARSVSGHWKQAAEQGLQRIGSELDAKIEWIRTDDPADDRRQLAEQGLARSKLVFCVGGYSETSLLSVARAYPETVFVLLPGMVHAANVAGIRFLPEEVGYLAGAVAGALSPDGRIGLVRGGGQPWLDLLEDGYVAGFKSRWRRTRVVAGEGPDGVWELSSAGVLVSLYAADQADPEVIAAAHNSGLQLVATDPRLLETEDVTVVAAVEVDLAEAMLRIAREVRDGTFEGRVFAFDLGSGVLDVVVNPGLAPDALHAANEALEEARAEITAGLVEFDSLGL